MGPRPFRAFQAGQGRAGPLWNDHTFVFLSISVLSWRPQCEVVDNVNMRVPNNNLPNSNPKNGIQVAGPDGRNSAYPGKMPKQSMSTGQSSHQKMRPKTTQGKENAIFSKRSINQRFSRFSVSQHTLTQGMNSLARTFA